MAMQGHLQPIFALDWHPNSYHVATGGADNTIKIWDLRKMRVLHTLAAHSSTVSDLRFFQASTKASAFLKMLDASAPDITGSWMVSSGYDGSIKIWSTGDWKLVKELLGHDGKVMSVDYVRDGKNFLSTGFDNTLKLWGLDK